MNLFGYQEQFHPEYDLHIFLINTISLSDIIAERLFFCRFRIFNLKIMTVIIIILVINAYTTCVF